MTLVLLLELIRTESLALLGTLARASIEGALVAGVVWAACRAVPSLPAAVRTWLWWLVCVKLLIGMLPVPAIPLPWLPATAASWTARPAPGGPAAPQSFAFAPTRDAASQVVPIAPAPGPVSVPYASFWPVLLAIGWLGLAALQALGLTRALRTARHLRRHAVPAPAGLIHRAAQLVRLFALPVVPRVLVSRLSAVPLITGVFRPAILLPASSTATFSRHELDLVLGHELAHVRRGDLVWGWVPAIASRLFFFHPLARLAIREYLAAREEACDAEVLHTLNAAPADYGQLLVKLGVATTDDGLAAAGASPTFALLKRRLIMLDRSRTPASRWWWTLAGATAVLVPLTLVAQPVAPGAPAAPPVPELSRLLAPPAPDAPPAWPLDPGDAPPAPPAPPAAPAPHAPPALPAPAATPTPAPASLPAPPAPPAAQAPLAPPAAQAPPAPPAAPSVDTERRRRSRHIETPWVLLEPGNRDVMSASPEDKAAAERERRGPDDTLLWFRYQGTPYVTRDAATMQAVRDAYAPIQVISGEMSRVGGKMRAQGSTQGAVGSRQGELGARQGELAAQMAKIAAAHAARVAVKMSQLKEQRALQVELEARMRALGDQQRALGEEMGAMGRKMAEHGVEMKAMGQRLESALEEAQTRAASLLGDAVDAGKATRAK